MTAFGFGPGLALRRGAGGGGFDFTGGAMPPGASLTRASAGTRINAAGLLASEGADVARFDHDPVTLACQGLLVEPARTNRLTFAEQFDNDAWTRSGVTVTANDRAAPDGMASADRLAMTGGGMLQRAGVGTAGGVMTGSVFLYAAAAAAGLQFGHWDNVAGAQYQSVSLAAGVWTRVAVTRTFGAGASDRRLNLVAPGGDVTLWAWGAQSEPAASGSSYIPAAAAAVTRAADALMLALPVAEGPQALRVTFADLTTQDLTVTVTGGAAPIPAAALTAPRVRRIDRL